MRRQASMDCNGGDDVTSNVSPRSSKYLLKKSASVESVLDVCDGTTEVGSKQTVE